MQIFSYHPATSEFIGVFLADPDPLNAGNWLIPAHAVTTAPPTAPGKAAVWSEGAWTLVDDHRGEIWYAGYGQPVEITTLQIPEGLTSVEPEAPPAPPRTIAGAYFRSALTDLGHMTTVRAALTDPIDLELFNTASEFNESAPDVNAVATALSIDLPAVFDRAEEIRAARQP